MRFLSGTIYRVSTAAACWAGKLLLRRCCVGGTRNVASTATAAATAAWPFSVTATPAEGRLASLPFEESTRQQRTFVGDFRQAGDITRFMFFCTYFCFMSPAPPVARGFLGTNVQ